MNTATLTATPFLDNMSNREVLTWLGTFPKMDAWEQEQVITSLAKRLEAAQEIVEDDVPTARCDFCDHELSCKHCDDESDDN